MTPLDAALLYASRGWPVFPCQWRGPRRKEPLTGHGFKSASRDFVQIAAWWGRDPAALVGVPTGEPSGIVVLDLDRKFGKNGFDTLEALGHSVLPDTPLAHTPSGGWHVYFANPPLGLRNSAGRLGPGIDLRATGGYILVPTKGSGYRWDPHLGIDTPLAPAPEWLWPEVKVVTPGKRPIPRRNGLSPYAEAALDSACRRIIAAVAGAQESTLNAEAFAIGTLAGAGGIPIAFARKVLIWAARQMRDYDPRHPWSQAEIELKVGRALDQGQQHPRRGNCAAA